MPYAAWWRISALQRNEDGHVYMITAKEEQNLFIVEWFDGLDVKLDMGLDKPNVDAICFVHIEPIEYIDLLMTHQPTPESYRITEYGDRFHPGYRVMPDLDRFAKGHRGK